MMRPVAPHVLLIPGFMQRGHSWAPVAELLAGRCQATRLDHAEHSYEGRLREIAAAGEGAVLCGYSLGGRLALRAAVREPGRYAGLVTVGATAGLDDPAQRLARAEADDRLASWMETAPIEDVVGVWERQPLFADQSERLVDAQRDGRLSHEPRDLALVLRSAGQGVLDPVWGELVTLQLPLLAIAGVRDEGYVRAARRMGDTAGRGHCALVQDAGHAAHLQQPEQVAGLIGDFAAGL